MAGMLGFLRLALQRARPTARIEHRGVLTVEPGGTGVADKLYLGRKNAADAYEWQSFQTEDADLTVIAGLVDPNADRILFWDDSAGAYAYLAPGTNLTITGTTIDASGGAASTESLLRPFALMGA